MYHVSLLAHQVMAVAGLDSSRAHRLSPTRSTRSWATPPATPASKDQSPYYTPLIRVDHPHRESAASSQVSVRKSSWYTDDPDFSHRMYSPVHLQVPPEYHNKYHQKRGSATSLVEAVSLRLALDVGRKEVCLAKYLLTGTVILTGRVILQNKIGQAR